MKTNLAKNLHAATPNFKLPSKSLVKKNPKQKMDAEDRRDAKNGIKQTKAEEKGEKS